MSKLLRGPRQKEALPSVSLHVRGQRSQRQFARDLGVFQQNVNRYESGTTPHADFLIQLAVQARRSRSTGCCSARGGCARGRSRRSPGRERALPSVARCAHAARPAVCSPRGDRPRFRIGARRAPGHGSCSAPGMVPVFACAGACCSPCRSLDDVALPARADRGLGGYGRRTRSRPGCSATSASSRGSRSTRSSTLAAVILVAQTRACRGGALALLGLLIATSAFAAAKPDVIQRSACSTGALVQAPQGGAQ